MSTETEDRKQTGRKANRKGKTGERDFIRSVYRISDGRVQLERNLRQSRNGGADMDYQGFSIEVKRWRRVSDALVRDWWAQCQANARNKGQVPVLACRADQQGWKVWMHTYQYFSEDDLRGCLSMDIELFVQMLLDPKHRLPVEYGTFHGQGQLA